MSHVHAYVQFFSFFLILFFISTFLLVFLSLSLSFFWIVCAWHLSANVLHLGTLFVLGHLLLLILHPVMLGFVMIKLVKTFQRTFLNVAFIQNAKLSFRISPILIYPLSLTVRVRNPFMIYWSIVPLWSYKSFTPICTDLIIPYLFFLLLFEIYVL